MIHDNDYVEIIIIRTMTVKINRTRQDFIAQFKID